MADFELPGYEVYERLGRGGMATVYRALHLNLDREVAIKVMDPSMNADESFSERFVREARISARLTHPHILQIYDVNNFDGLNYIAMELLAGGELADFIHSEMPQKQIYQILQQMTEALDYAAGRGYIHRDIKPSNIMLRAEEDFVLADFGIARAANSGTQMTQTGLMVGTPSYMSPEQAKGQEVDGRSDLYALAVLAYEMLTKTLPYESDSAVTTAVKHLTEDIPTLPEKLAAYQGFLDKGLAKSADDRFQTGREMYDAFMAASADFGDDEVLTEGRKPAVSSASGVHDGADDRTSLAGVDATRMSHSSSPAVSHASRPYRLEGSSTQRERMVSGTYGEPRASKKSGSSPLRMIALVVVLGGLGFGGYTWWQAQQGGASKDLSKVTADLATAYSAMNQDDLGAAARAFFKVLQKDKSNAAASQGMGQLQQMYDTQITQALAGKDVNKARDLVMDYSAYYPSSLNVERYSAEIELLEQQQNLASVKGERIEQLTDEAAALVATGEFEQAQGLIDQAVAIDSSSTAVSAAQAELEDAEAASTAYEERWSQYTEEQRVEFNAALAAADEALDAGDLAQAEASIAAAAAVAEDAPELTRRADRLSAAQEQVAAAAAAEEQRLAGLVEEATAAAASIAENPDNAAAAVALYNQVLEADPGNTDASAGIDSIADYYLKIAKQAAREGDFDGARQALGAASAVLPQDEGLNDYAASLAGLEQSWQAREEEATRQREAQAAAVAKAQETAGRGVRAVSSGALDIAQQAYDEVVQTHPDLPEVKNLQQSLLQAYAQSARNQIDLKEFDAAQEVVAQGVSSFPDDAIWAELEAEIETGRNSSRRRLGAY